MSEPSTEQPKYGARVYFYPEDGTILVKQTILRGTPPKYIIDGDKEKHAPIDNDAQIAAAIRGAISGILPDKQL